MGDFEKSSLRGLSSRASGSVYVLLGEGVGEVYRNRKEGTNERVGGGEAREAAEME